MNSVVDHSVDRSNAALGTQPEVLTKIFNDDVNLACYERDLVPEISQYSQALIDHNRSFSIRSSVSVERRDSILETLLPKLPGHNVFVEDLSLLIDMYACLFDLEEVGLRLQILDRAMCPRFHTDKLGCRLVMTYKGQGSEWLYNCDLDRSKLGPGNRGLSDEESGLYSSTAPVLQAGEGDVLLLKGDGWFNNEGRGIVHRSPAVAPGDTRIVVTMDFA